MSDDKWKQKLTPEQYWVLRQKGTEAPFTGELLYNQAIGMYSCAACGADIFSSEHKYESDIPSLQGWPSFADVSKSDAVELRPDTSLGMERTEVLCSQCGSHLGHLFDDSSAPTGKHYCINSVALGFKPQKQKD